MIRIILFVLIAGGLSLFAMVSFSAPGKHPANAFNAGNQEFEKKNYVKALDYYQQALEHEKNSEKALEIQYQIGLCYVRLNRERDYRQKFEEFISDYLETTKGTIWEARAYYLKGLAFQNYYYYPDGEIHPFEQARLIYNDYLKSKKLRAQELLETDIRLAEALEAQIYNYSYRRMEHQRQEMDNPPAGDDPFYEEWERESLKETDAKYHKEWEIRKRIVYLFREMSRLSKKPADQFTVHYNLAHFLRRQARTEIYTQEAIKRFRDVTAEAPDTKLREDAQFSIAFFYLEQENWLTAETELEALIRKFPTSRWVSDARRALQQIRKKELRMDVQTAFLPDQTPTITVTTRNLKAVEFTLYPFDFAEFLQSAAGLKAEALNHFNELFGDIEQAVKYADKPLHKWTETVEDRDDHNPVATELTLDLNEIKKGEPVIGTYLLVGKRGQNSTAALIVVSDLTIIQRTADDKVVTFVADALSGAPVPNAEVTILKHQHQFQGVSDENGLFETHTALSSCAGYSCFIASYAVVGNRFAATPQQYGYSYREDRRQIQSYTITDRPVYRPEQMVYFKHIFRENRDGVYFPLNNTDVRVIIKDPRWSTVLDTTLQTNEFGSIAGSYTLPEEAPLGVYRFELSRKNQRIYAASAPQFRVEEYKRPEVKLNVSADESNLRVGETIKITLNAEYYFGGGVADADVNYTIRRQNYRPTFYSGNEYDWLYGRGFDDENRDRGWWWYRWWYYDRNETLMTSGSAKTDAEGNVEIEIKTDDLLTDEWEDAYLITIEANVTDASRRQIDARKEIILPVSEFYAYVESERNFLLPNEKAKFTIFTLTPNYAPKDADGTVRVLKLTPKDDPQENEDPYTEKEIYSEELSTKNGRGEFIWIPKDDGRFRIRFEARDKREALVTGQTELWVAGEKFSGRTYRFANLQVTTNKSTYAEGETAHLLITTAQNESHVFLTSGANRDLYGAQVIAIKGGAKTIPLKITEQHVPNFFITGYQVQKGVIETDNRQVFVPPAKHFINVDLTADKTTYKPGETGTFTLKTTDSQGKPIVAEVALSVFDASLLYIQNETSPDIRRYYYGSLRGDATGTQNSFDYRLAPVSEDKTTYKDYERHGYPDGWYGLSDGLRYELLGEEIDQRTEHMSMGAAGEGRQVMAMDMAAPAPMAEEAPMMKSAPTEEAEFTDADETRRDANEKKKEGANVEPEVRTNFAETALWRPFVVTDENGEATVDCDFPDALTTWRASAKAVSGKTHVGEAMTEVRTKKEVLVRLQAPRFFVERDEVVISANVHNYSETVQELTVELGIRDQGSGVSKLLRLISAENPVQITLAPNSEERVDWRVAVVGNGEVTIRVSAASPQDGDAMELTFPVFEYGIEKMVAHLGDLRTTDQAEFTLTVPDEIKQGSQNLQIVLSPSLAAITIDALPYLADYPYGCFEQTINRFVPAVLVAKTLQNLGMNLEDLEHARKNIMAKELAAGRYRHRESPVYDSQELQQMIDTGLNRIPKFQNRDGGFGWWTQDSQSDPYMTALGVNSLIIAQSCDLNVNQNMLRRAVNYLQNYVKTRDNVPENLQTYIYYALSNYDPKKIDMEALDTLFGRRDELSYYSWALLGLTYTNKVLEELGTFRRGQLMVASLDEPLVEQNLDSPAFEKMDILRQNLLDRMRTDDQNGTAFWQPEGSYWWYWWNNRVETTATTLQFLNRVDPHNENLPRVVKWLVNNRRGNRWYSTKDTALGVHVLLEYARSQGELDADYELTVKMDGEPLKVIRVTPENLLTFDNKIFVEAPELNRGEHQIEISKNGTGNLYYSAFVEYFTQEEQIEGTGNEIFITRTYFKKAEAGGEKQTLADGDRLNSGDEIEVELTIHAKNDYDYLVFEDMKPAGCEFTQLKSAGGYMELRDEKAVFFRHSLRQGETTIRYNLRAEIPGDFHALPTKGLAMYAPDVRSISDSFTLKIED